MYLQAEDTKKWPILGSMGYKSINVLLEDEKAVLQTFTHPSAEIPDLCFTMKKAERLQGKLIRTVSIYRVIDEKPYLLKEENNLRTSPYSMEFILLDLIFELVFSPEEIAFWELLAICYQAESKDVFDLDWISKIRTEYFPELETADNQPIKLPPFIVEENSLYQFSNPKILNYLMAREINKKGESRFKGSLNSFISKDNYRFLNYEVEGQLDIIINMIQAKRDSHVSDKDKDKKKEQEFSFWKFGQQIEVDYLKTNWPNLKNGDISEYVKRLEEIEW